MRRISAALILLAALVPVGADADTASVTVMVTAYIPPVCSDGLDNDGDLLIDYPSDTGCTSALDGDETNILAECGDALDNDGDLLIDYPADPGCDSTFDLSEANLPPGGGGGGGGGASDDGEKARITLTGNAYPRSEITLFRGNRLLLRSVAGPDSRFSLTAELGEGNHALSLLAKDSTGVRSSLFSLPITVSKGSSTTVGGIFLSPTLSVRSKEVRRGETVTFFGQSVPNGAITLEVNSEVPHFYDAASDGNGAYLVQVNSGELENGAHVAQSKAALNSLVSSVSQPVSFRVGTGVADGGGASEHKGDMNGDSTVNILDFSMAAYWYQRTLSSDALTLEMNFLSGDGVIDIRDFSIMAYYWTN